MSRRPDPVRDTLPGDPGYGRGPQWTDVDAKHTGRWDYRDRSAAMNTLQEEMMRRALNPYSGPSIADAQLNAAQQRAGNQQMSMAAAGRPGQGGMAQRMAMQNAGRIQSDLAQQAVAARLQEEQMHLANQRAYQGLLADYLLRGRGQDAATAGFGTEQQGGMGPLGAVGGVAGGIVGGYFGGPAGAVGGYQVGSGIMGGLDY